MPGDASRASPTISPWMAESTFKTRARVRPRAGADTFVSGTTLFGRPSLGAAVKKMRKAVETARAERLQTWSFNRDETRANRRLSAALAPFAGEARGRMCCPSRVRFRSWQWCFGLCQHRLRKTFPPAIDTREPRPILPRKEMNEQMTKHSHPRRKEPLWKPDVVTPSPNPPAKPPAEPRPPRN